MLKQEFVKQATKKHNGKYTYDHLPEKVILSTKYSFTCPIHGEFKQIARQHLHTTGCEKCSYEARGSNQKMSLETFIKKANAIHNNKYTYDKVVLGKRLNAPVIMTCPIHGDFLKRPDKHLAGQGCYKCSKGYRRTHDQYMEEVKKLYGDKYNLSKIKFKTVDDYITIGCPIHGFVEQKAWNFLKGKGCPRCNGARSENTLIEFFNKYNIPYKHNHKFYGSMYKYDFYLEQFNIIIEIDGKHHREVIDHWGGEDYLKYVQKHDREKNDFAKVLGIPLHRIVYVKNMDKQLLLKEVINIIKRYYPYYHNGKFYRSILSLQNDVIINSKTPLIKVAEKYSISNLIK